MPPSLVESESASASSVDGGSFEGESAQDLRLVPVVIREADDHQRPTTAPFVVDLPGGASVRVTAGFDATELRRLVETLEDIRC